MSLITHAKRELKLAGLFDKDSDYNGDLGKAVMELIEVFSKQGHSGASAGRAIELFRIVASYKNLIALTGKDDELVDVSDDCFQNNRVSSVFKKKKTGKAYYLNAITWVCEKSSWVGDVSGITSRQYIKSFPFAPKTFYIDIIEKEIKKDEWEFTIKDKKQLKEVFEYYDEYKNNK